MKKITALLLTGTMLFTLAACGDTDKPESSSGPAPDPVPPAASASDPQTSTELLGEFNPSGTIEETILFEEGDVRITATELTYGGYSADLQLLIENNSGEELNFTSGTLGYSCNSVNGMMVEDGYLNCDVAEGKKAMERISFGYDTLRLYGIREIADLEVGISIVDQDYDRMDLPPFRVLTSLHEQYAYDPLSYQKTISSAAAQNTFGYEVSCFADDRLYEQAGIAVLSQALIKNADGASMLLVEAENQSGEIRTLSAENVAVDNVIVHRGASGSVTLAPGKRGLIDLDLSTVLDPQVSALCGMEMIGAVSFDLQQYNMEGSTLPGKETVRVLCGEPSPVDMSGDELYHQNGTRIVSKAVLAPESGIYYTVLLLAENTGDTDLSLTIPLHTTSVNGFMVDCFGGTWELKPGQFSLMKLELYERDLEEISVTEAEQIEQVEFELEVRSGNARVETSAILANFTA